MLKLSERLVFPSAVLQLRAHENALAVTLTLYVQGPSKSSTSPSVFPSMLGTEVSISTVVWSVFPSG